MRPLMTLPPSAEPQNDLLALLDMQRGLTPQMQSFLPLGPSREVAQDPSTVMQPPQMKRPQGIQGGAPSNQLQMLQDALKTQQEQRAPYYQEAEQAINQQDEAYKKLQALNNELNQSRTQQLDLSPLIAYADAFNKTNMLQSYKRPKTLEEQKADELKTLMGLNDEQGKVAASRLNLAKSVGADNSAMAMANAYARMAAAQGKEKRGDENLAFREEQAIDNKVEKLSSRLEKTGLAELDPVVGTILSNIDLDAKTDIEGVGRTAGVPSFVLEMSGSKGPEIRQSVDALRNIIIKARSGGAVTPQEANRFLEELGYGVNRTDQQLRQGLKNVISQMKAKKEAILAGYNEPVKQKYVEQGGNVGVIGQTTKAPAKITVSNGKETLLIDAADLASAQADGFQQVK